MGFEYVLPKAIKDKRVSAIEVGIFDEAGLAVELNRFLGTNILDLKRTNTYVLVHPPDALGIESLLSGKPFVDPIIHRATLNESLALMLGIKFDYVLQSMLRPGTSDAQGDVALRQALLALGKEWSPGDLGFYSPQYFLRSDNITEKQLREVCDFLANPALNTSIIMNRRQYETSLCVFAPIVTLPPTIKVETYDVANMTDTELLEMNSARKLAATLEELRQFSGMYKDEAFIKKRAEFGLTSLATDVEIEAWFGLRSEHCFHKELNAFITLEDRANDPVFAMAFDKGWLTKDEQGNYVLENGMFKTFIQTPAEIIYQRLEKRGNNWIASMFSGGAGAVFYNEKYMFCIKWETHNSPSNKEPIQGAKTGIDGVNRDIFGMMLGTFDAIANFFFYCTGNPDYRGWLPAGVKHPYVIQKGVTQGVREGGNESQIPTLGGGVITDPRYIAKCLVYCGTVGWSPVFAPDGRSYIEKHPSVGDLVFVVGQAVGVDGIHGATESSLKASANISLGHVQADFSFIQAKSKEWSLECARDFLFTSIDDCGAMGIGVINEMARDVGGVVLDLNLHPKKYAGIWPWQIECSETQDRWPVAAKPEDKAELLRRAKLHEVDLTELGTFTDSGYVHLKYGDQTVALIDINKLFDKEPRKRMHATWYERPEEKEIQIQNTYSLEESLCLVMSRPDVASKEWFFRQKDSSVKGGTIQGPLIGLKQEVEADATIQKPLDTEGEDYGALAYSVGIAPKLSDIDPYLAVQRSFADMAGKIIAVGGALPDMSTPKWDAWAVCGNYCQPDSESRTTLTKESGEHNLASWVREGIAACEFELETNIPVTSGKDSAKCSCVYEVSDSFNLEEVPLDLRRHINLVEKEKVVRDEKTCRETTKMQKYIEIHDPDSYLASCAVRIEDYRKCVNSAFKQGGDLIYVIGRTGDDLGASQYLSAIGYNEIGAPIEGGYASSLNFAEFVKTCNNVHAAIDHELVASCSYIHNGGLGAAIAKAAIAGEKGAELDLGNMKAEGVSSDETMMYSETSGRFIMTIAPEDKERFEAVMSEGNACYSLIGAVSDGEEESDLVLSVKKLDASIEQIALANIKESYQRPLRYGLDDVV